MLGSRSHPSATQEGESGLTSQRRKLKLREAKGFPKVTQPGSRHHPAFWQFQKRSPAPRCLVLRVPSAPAGDPHTCVGRASSAWGKCHPFVMTLAALRTISISRRSQNCTCLAQGQRSVVSQHRPPWRLHLGTWASIHGRILRWL